MAQQTINIGATPDDGTGDDLRTGGDKLNDNFTELYTTTADHETRVDAAETSIADHETRIDTLEAAGGGVADFTDLGDVPASYTGGALKALRVNAGETALEFYTPGAGYTDEQARDAIGAALTAGTGISVTVNDGADTITVAIDTAVVDERARDALGTALTAGTGITLTPNDGADTITVAIDTAAVDERARDALGAALTAGTGITLTPNDGADTITVAVDATAVKPTECLIIACSDEATALAAGTGKVTWRMPYAFTLTAVRGSLTVAQTSGSIFTIDINESGTSILSTKLTIDNTEKTSTTAATAAVISDSSLADDAEMSIDFDQVGDGTAKGAKVYLIGHRT